MEERIKLTADASDVTRALAKLQKSKKELEGKTRVGGGGGVAKGIESAAKAVQGGLGGITQVLSSVHPVAAAAVGVAAAAGAAVMAINNHVNDLRAARGDASNSLDDWSDKGNALGMTGADGVAGAMAAQRTLIGAGASPAAVDRMLGAWATNQGQLTDQDRKQLGIDGLDGGEAIVKLVQDFPQLDEAAQKAVASLLAIDGRKLGIVRSAMQAGATDDMLQSYRQSKTDLRSIINPASLEASGKRELALLDGEHRKTIYATADADVLVRDGEHERDKMIRQAKLAGNQIGVLQSGWGATKEFGSNLKEAWNGERQQAFEKSVKGKEQLEEARKQTELLKKMVEGQGTDTTKITAQ